MTRAVLRSSIISNFATASVSNTLLRDWLKILAHFSQPIRRQPAVTCSLAFPRANARAMIGPLHFLSNVETGTKRSF